MVQQMKAPHQKGHDGEGPLAQAVDWAKERKLLVGAGLALVLFAVALVLAQPGPLFSAKSATEHPGGPAATAGSAGQVADGEVDADPAGATGVATEEDDEPGSEPGDPAGRDGSISPVDDAATPSTPGQETEFAESPSQEPADQGSEIMDGNHPDYQMAPEVQDPEPDAYAFAEAWANPEGGHAKWLERMEPYTTPTAYEGLSYVDEMWLREGTVRLVNVGVVDDGVYQIPISVFLDEDRTPAMDAVMVQQPDGSWKIDQVHEGGALKF